MAVFGYSDKARTTEALKGVVGNQLTYRGPDTDAAKIPQTKEKKYLTRGIHEHFANRYIVGA